MPEGEAIGAAFVEISARNESLKASLAESKEIVKAELTKTEANAFITLSARNEKLQADLEEAVAMTKAAALEAKSAAVLEAKSAINLEDPIRSSIGGIRLLRDEQTKTAGSMTEMGYVGRRELIMLSSQFGITGVAAQRMFMLIQAHSPAASAAIGKIGSALMVAGVAAMAEQAILSGIQKHFDRQLEAAKTANDLAQK
jgi:hypothetical protein